LKKIINLSRVVLKKANYFKQLHSKLKYQKSLTFFISILFLSVLIIFFAIGNKNFLGSFNLRNIGDVVSVLLIVGLGQMSVLLIGGIDLSIGPNISLATVFTIISLQRFGYIGFFIPIFIACMIGMINGIIVAKIRIPFLSATIGTGGIIKSFVILLSKGRSVPATSGTFKYLDVVNGSIIGMNNVWLIVCIIAIIFYLLLNRTIFGKLIYAVGCDEQVARTSGIHVDRVRIFAFALLGFFAGVAGILLACKLFGGSPIIGDAYILQSVAVAVVGGVTVTGGVGGVLNVLMGALIIGIIKNGMTVVGINIFAQQIVFGIMIIIAVAVTFDRSKGALLGIK